MDVRTLVEEFDELANAGDMPADATLIALFRNLDVDIGHDDAWVPCPITRIELDDGDVDFILAGEGEPHVTATELRAWVAQESPADAQIYVPAEWESVEDDWWVRKDTPTIATVFNPEAAMFGVMVEYEGHEAELD